MKDCTLSDGGIVFALQWNFNNSILGGLPFACGWQYLQMTSCAENIPQDVDHLLQLQHPPPPIHPITPPRSKDGMEFLHLLNPYYPQAADQKYQLDQNTHQIYFWKCGRLTLVGPTSWEYLWECDEEIDKKKIETFFNMLKGSQF